MSLVRRNRRSESYLDRKPLSNLEEVVSKAAEEVVKHRDEAEVYVEDDGWLSVLVSWIRIITCFLIMMITTIVWVLVMLVLLPWPYERIKQGNIYGHVTGRLLVRNHSC